MRPRPCARRSRMTANSRSTSCGVRAALGSSMTRRRASSEGLGDFDDLLLRDGEFAARDVRVNVDAEPGEQLGGLRRSSSRRSSPPQSLATEEDIFPRRQGGDQIELLVDDRHAGALGVLGRGCAPAGRRRGSCRRRPLRAAEDLDERAFAGAVFAEQGEHFAGLQVQVHAPQRLHAGERLENATHLEQGRHRLVTSPPDPCPRPPCDRARWE